ncbi:MULTISPECIES: formimidoylglutamate deiminase [unclassified Rhizobium]|uniref:formimidoylglutamate deiminase n=1 Tax=unclassified Rhizobium TaxID=2613769 RepID=UPI0007135D9B|nr:MULTISPECIES: formimidoylglutamate deiminase [unclassified Rhizobium]KQS89549.1 N-formimino-L-glutamate deiminase [Rhizobium sp. Leaf391]KQS94828.1 N-formimino-L-glutamate deiminase [Rhizobium sp. Leaf386]KQU01204.1 N-formimino-L-glutamate deiminase [Rhizobium sp. Leaf453]
MTSIHVKSALTPTGWQKDVRLTIEGGRIASLEAGVAAQSGDERHDIVVPGMPNLHSHAFQRGMAGLAEARGPGADSFWSWRNVMYRFALSMTPDHVEAVASQLYMEMLEAGFSRVGEFHYLHHDIDGGSYADIAEMAQRIASAASETGIGLTLLPVFYAHSTFGGAAPNEGQRRFINSTESFGRLLEGCRAAVKGLSDGKVGVAPHSLRAVTPEELSAVVAMAKDGPIHIHVAEQVKEVEDCIAWSGARPVQWLLDNTDLDGRWCLIHATHMTDDETRRMAERKAIAGLCPITEANLGDGTFNAVVFGEHGGKFGFGSDSNVLIGLPDELRQLEYSQRLAHRSRNVLAAPGQSTGRALFDGAIDGGGIALSTKTGLAAGNPADFVSLTVPDIGGQTDDVILDSWLFANGTKPDCVWVAGRKQVAGGCHAKRDAIYSRFRATMQELLG